MEFKKAIRPAGVTWGSPVQLEAGKRESFKNVVKAKVVERRRREHVF